MTGIQNHGVSRSGANGRRRPAIGISAQHRNAFGRDAGDLFELPYNYFQMGSQFPGVERVN